MRPGRVSAQGSPEARPESESQRGRQAFSCCLLTAVLVLGALGAIYRRREGLSHRTIALFAGAGVTVLVGIGCLLRRRAVEAGPQPPPGPQPPISVRVPIDTGARPPADPGPRRRPEQFWPELLGPVLGAQMAAAERGKTRNFDWDTTAVALVGNPANWVHYPRLADIRFGVDRTSASHRREEMAALQSMKVSVEQAAVGPDVAQRFIQGACAYLAPRYLGHSPDRRQQHAAVLADMAETETDLYPLGIHLINSHMAEELDGIEGARAQTTHTLKQLQLFYNVGAHQRHWVFTMHSHPHSPIESAYFINAVAFLIERSHWAQAHGGVELVSLETAVETYLVVWARNWRQAEFEALTSRLRGRVQSGLLQPLFNHWYTDLPKMTTTRRGRQEPFLQMVRALGLAPPTAPAVAT